MPLTNLPRISAIELLLVNYDNNETLNSITDFLDGNKNYSIDEILLAVGVTAEEIVAARLNIKK